MRPAAFAAFETSAAHENQRQQFTFGRRPFGVRYRLADTPLTTHDDVTVAAVGEPVAYPYLARMRRSKHNLKVVLLFRKRHVFTVGYREVNVTDGYWLARLYLGGAARSLEDLG